jgi:hypothetical protein
MRSDRLCETAQDAYTLVLEMSRPEPNIQIAISIVENSPDSDVNLVLREDAPIFTYAGPPLQAAISALGSHYEENRSGRLNTVCERYMAMVADELARINLSKGEWCAIMDANNGVEQYLGGAAMMPSMLWANVHDSGSQLREKWGIDETRLVKKMQQMSKSTLIAIQEVCDRFWSHTDRHTDEALATAGVKVRTD